MVERISAVAEIRHNKPISTHTVTVFFNLYHRQFTEDGMNDRVKRVN